MPLTVCDSSPGWIGISLPCVVGKKVLLVQVGVAVVRVVTVFFHSMCSILSALLSFLRKPKSPRFSEKQVFSAWEGEGWIKEPGFSRFPEHEPFPFVLGQPGVRRGRCARPAQAPSGSAGGKRRFYTNAEKWTISEKRHRTANNDSGARCVNVPFKIWHH